MTTDSNKPEACAADAIAAISREGKRRQRSSRRTLFAAIAAALVMAVIAVWGLLPTEPDAGPVLATRKVALLLPNKDTGAVADNASLQWRGYVAAYKQHRVSESEQLVMHFDYPLPADGGRQAIIERMQDWYSEGVRTFIITMSGAVTAVKEDFITWRKTIAIEEDRPLLIATVASAPEIADGANGIFRHYIRSRDESGVLAGYVEAHDATEVFVFYVKDTYGIRAKDILRNRVDDATVQAFGVPVAFNTTAAEKLRSDVKTVQRETTSGTNAVVIIIGYGGMIQEAVLALQREGFAGRTLVVSTFTEQQWRPPVGVEEGALTAEFAARVYAVAPVQSGTGRNTGVVVQFSYLTLDHALSCQEKLGVSEFSACWNETTGSTRVNELEIPAVQVEFTQLGDSHVSLRLLSLSELAE